MNLSEYVHRYIFMIRSCSRAGNLNRATSFSALFREVTADFYWHATMTKLGEFSEDFFLKIIELSNINRSFEENIAP